MKLNEITEPILVDVHQLAFFVGEAEAFARQGVKPNKSQFNRMFIEHTYYAVNFHDLHVTGHRKQWFLPNQRTDTRQHTAMEALKSMLGDIPLEDALEAPHVKRFIRKIARLPKISRFIVVTSSNGGAPVRNQEIRFLVAITPGAETTPKPYLGPVNEITQPTIDGVSLIYNARYLKRKDNRPIEDFFMTTRHDNVHPTDRLQGLSNLLSQYGAKQQWKVQNLSEDQLQDVIKQAITKLAEQTPYSYEQIIAANTVQAFILALQRNRHRLVKLYFLDQSQRRAPSLFAFLRTDHLQ